MEILFWFAFVGCIYSYALYPLILFVMRKRRWAGVKSEGSESVADNVAHLDDENLPKISLIITVHNEAHRIRSKIENTLMLIYPKDNIELVVASDGSTDETNNIVQEYSDRSVLLVDVVEHKGKENAQLQGIKASSGDIIIFSDVATEIQPDSIKKLVAYFSNEKIGAVSSEDRFVSKDGSVAGEGAYVKYEMWLRQVESGVAGLVGLSGSFFAARRSVLENWDIVSPSDFNTALNCAKNGVVAVTMPDVHGYYQDLADSSKEYQRKIRTLIRGFTAITRHKEVLNFSQFGVFAFQVWSHKVMRWAVPWFMLLFLLLSFALWNDGAIYFTALMAQLAFYSIVILAYVKPSLQQRTAFKIPLFFVQVNIAIAHATLLFLSGKRMVTWTPSKR